MDDGEGWPVGPVLLLRNVETRLPAPPVIVVRAEPQSGPGSLVPTLSRQNLSHDPLWLSSGSDTTGSPL